MVSSSKSREALSYDWGLSGIAPVWSSCSGLPEQAKVPRRNESPGNTVYGTSTGDMLRDNIHRDTELARQAKLLINRGRLVSDDIVVGMVQDRIVQSDQENGFVLDGFPRTLPQAQGLEGICGLYKSKSITVLNLVVKPDLLIRRLENRRICKLSGHIYSLADRPPVCPGICDHDGSELMQRPDDTEAVIRERILTYEQHIHPVIDYYSSRNLLYDVDAIADPDIVMANIMKVLDVEEAAK